MEIKTTEEIWDETSDIDDEYNRAIDRGTEQKEFERLTENRWKHLEKKWVSISDVIKLVNDHVNWLPEQKRLLELLTSNSTKLPEDKPQGT